MNFKILFILFLVLSIYLVNGESIDELFSDAESEYNLGNFDSAISIYDQIIKINTDRADAWRGKGRALIELGKYAQAVGALDKAIELNPNSPYSWYFKGNALAGLKKIDEAIAAYDKSLTILPNFSKAQKRKELLISTTKSLNEEKETDNMVINYATRSPTINNYDDEYQKGKYAPKKEAENGAPFSFLRIFFDYWYIWAFFIIIAYYIDPILGSIILLAPFILFFLAIAYILLVIGLKLLWVFFSYMVGLNMIKPIVINPLNY